MHRLILPLAFLGIPTLYSCQSPKVKEQLAGKEAAQQDTALRPRLQQIIATYKEAHVGMALVHIEKGDTLSLNNDVQYPMQSTYKFPLALAVLQQVDKGVLSLDQKVHIEAKDLRRATWSPMLKEHPKGDIDLTVRDLIRYTVSQSDNNACDVLFHLIGGPATVQQYLEQTGISGINVRNTEGEMAKGWEVQYANWAHPKAMTDLLVLFQQGKLLSAGSNAVLLDFMTRSANSSKRIKGLLPTDIVVAHKTGTSDTNKDSLTAATNDAGIITLSNGEHIALTVFVKDSKASGDTNEKIIALLADAVFRHYKK